VTMRNGEIRTDALVEECCTIPKGWGREIIIENNEMYCGKILEFKKGCKFSMHFHMEKDETWWVEKGNSYRVSPGDSQKEVYDKLKKEDFLL